jgi:hypothetical protein
MLKSLKCCIRHTKTLDFQESATNADETALPLLTTNANSNMDTQVMTARTASSLLLQQQQQDPASSPSSPRPHHNSQQLLETPNNPSSLAAPAARTKQNSTTTTSTTTSSTLTANAHSFVVLDGSGADDAEAITGGC